MADYGLYMAYMAYIKAYAFLLKRTKLTVFQHLLQYIEKQVIHVLNQPYFITKKKIWAGKVNILSRMKLYALQFSVKANVVPVLCCSSHDSGQQ